MNSTRERPLLVILGASYAREWGTPRLPGYRVVNRGVGGHRTGDLRARFEQDVVGERARVVLIWGHINNVTQADIVNLAPSGVEQLEAAVRLDYETMLAAARAAGIGVILATEVPLAEPRGLANRARALLGWLRGRQSYASRVNRVVRNLNEFVRQLADREGLVLLDFERVFAPDGGPRLSVYARADSSHIPATGYEALTRYTVAHLGP